VKNRLANFREYKIPLLGRDVTVTDVPIQNADEKVSEYVLEDGVRLKVRTVVTAALRIKDQYDGDGNPIYFLKNSIFCSAVNVPTNLRKPSKDK
jgi:hypothetical protein